MFDTVVQATTLQILDAEPLTNDSPRLGHAGSTRAQFAAGFGITFEDLRHRPYWKTGNRDASRKLKCRSNRRTSELTKDQPSQGIAGLHA